MGPSTPDLTIARIAALAAVDAINPCALAVLTLVLISILTYNPGEKRKVLLAGLSFSGAVFGMYLVYGFLIVEFFHWIQAIASVRLYVYRALASLAILLGLLNIKDFLRYKPGGVGTEMPMFLRPKMQDTVAEITGPAGAFFIGIFVTLFLLPCTIGPYIIAGGILSVKEFLGTLPWLIFYNIIFIVPMLAITLLVYLGAVKIGQVPKWRNRNIRYMHLSAGLIMFLLGVAMLMGWV